MKCFWAINMEDFLSPIQVPHGGGPITVMVTRIARPGRESDLEEFVSGIVSAASRFEGLMAAMILRPSTPGGRVYRILARFDGEESFRRWERSDERLRWIAREAQLADGPSRWEHRNGLETWFDLPGSPLPAPPRYKAFLLSWLGAIPLYTIVNITLGDVFKAMPLFVRAPLYTGLLLLGMTYLIMPVLSRRFYRWLHGVDAESI